MRRANILIGLLVPLLAAGCFSLGRTTPALEQYVLGGAPPTADGEVAPAIGLAIGMRRLDLAPYLATPAILVRRGAHQIVESEFHRWAGDPAEGINRAVAGYLAAGTAVGIVDVAPWAVRSRYDFLVQLHVSRFEGVAPADTTAVEGAAHLLAAWEVIQQSDGAVLARGSTDYRGTGWRIGDYAGLVTLLDRGLSGLALDVTRCLQELVPTVRVNGAAQLPADRGPTLTCGATAEQPRRP